MINYLISALVNFDGAILVLYFVVAWKQRSREAVAMTLLFAFVALAFVVYDQPIDDVYQFSLFACLYLTAGHWLYKRGDLATFGALMIAVYYAIYALDSWINSDAETWIWRNHEILVTSLHVFIMLLLSKIRPALVRSRFHA